MLHLAFPGLSCDEGLYGQAVADRWGVALTTANPMDVPALLSPDPARCARDVYFHPTVAMLEPLIEKGLERGIRTTLTGLGSDQLMHRTGVECAGLLRRGHPRSAARSVGSLRAAVREGLVPLLPYPVQRTILRRLRRVPPAWRWLRPAWLAEMLHEMEAVERNTYDLGPELEASETVARILWCFDTSLVLSQGDRHAAGFGAERRHPFLDRRVVDLLLGMPPEERYHDGVLKPVFRRAMNGTLPPLVRDRSDKAHFTDYLQEHFYRPYWGKIRELARQSRLAEEGIVDGDAIRRFLSDGPGPTFPPLELINFVAVELWYRSVEVGDQPPRTLPSWDGTPNPPRIPSGGASDPLNAMMNRRNEDAMTNQESRDNASSHQVEPKRRAYVKPAVADLGDVRELTRGGAGSKPEAHSGGHK
jgi:asparagine synthetase B (glutamine-hydrolysing)